ncbi:metal/formaldehyde-sensitive transcriptional repressor [Uliginosibacterium sp. H1]|uniref:metal/formaldehyde-sensitive transcriptional repressor n=1 Tax=Uliginosibacterium sp. H1 TaxID=3114757 RepID=UPI002E17BDF5|nr:metal/formaldehyde-sensitive transcriptional repressor [Uliginosibacterium sp. H1]
MPHTVGNKKLLTRVRRIQGQVQALENALNDGAECGAVLQQIAAVRGAVTGLMSEVIDGHVREHLGREDVPQAEREADVEQLLSVLKSYLR